ncbi:MAG: tRNA pseudouridine(55) synthase TruB [Rhodothalassiaceae bacterium]
MARRRRGRKIDGWLVLDKPAGMTSTAALGAVKRLAQPIKAGHGGTLDPLATGVLPIGLGEATKAMAYMLNSDKAYDFTLRWGIATDSDDAEGAVVAEGGPVPNAAAIASVLGDFRREIDQVPPVYSAVKLEGQRAYDLARAGATVTLAPRRVRIDRLDLVEAAGTTARFSLACSKGTYVRALARDLARALGTHAHIVALRRTRAGPFDQKPAITLEKLEALRHKGLMDQAILPIATGLADIPALAVTGNEAARLRAGQSLTLPTAVEGTARITQDDTLIAIAEVVQGCARPLRVFNL